MDGIPIIKTPREYRVVKSLLEHGLVSRHNMDGLSGAENSPEVKRNLRDRGWAIYCKRFKMIDRDGKACSPGYYYLDDSVLDKAVAATEKWEAAATASHTDTPEPYKNQPSGK